MSDAEAKADDAEAQAEDVPAPPKPKAKLASAIASDITSGKKKKALKKASKKGKGKKKSKGKGKKGKGGAKKKKKKDKDDQKDPQYDASGKQIKFKEGPEVLKAFGTVVGMRNYKEQLEFFLNAMWGDFGDKKKKAQDQREEMYAWVLKMEELAIDAKDNKSDTDLDDFQAARFLEHVGKTMTVIERRKQFRDIDIDKNNRMGLLEYLVYRFKVNVIDMMNKPQGTNAALKAASKELKNVMKEIDAIESEKARLKKLIDAGSGVKSVRAKAELAQLESADPLPLNRAIITAEAALRKAQKSKDLSAAGKLWIMDYELKMAKAYKPKGGVKKGRFSVST